MTITTATATTSAPTPAGADIVRRTLRRHAAGVTVITVPGPAGFTATSFTSVSLEPALVSFCIGVHAPPARQYAAPNGSPSTSWAPRTRNSARSSPAAASTASRHVAVEGRSAAPGRRTRLANRTGHTASAGRRPSACRRGGRGRWRSRSGTGTRPPRRGVRHGSTHTAARRLTPRARQGMDTGRPGVHAAHRVWRSPARDGLNPARQVTGRKLRARSVPTGHLVSLFPSGAPAALPVLKKVGTPTTTPMKAVRR